MKNCKRTHEWETDREKRRTRREIGGKKHKHKQVYVQHKIGKVFELVSRHLNRNPIDFD